MQYLSGGLLADFENWFLPALWEIDEEDENTRDLAGTVHILISEFSRGDRTLEEMRAGLTQTIRTSGENYYGDMSQRAESFDTTLVAA